MPTFKHHMRTRVPMQVALLLIVVSISSQLVRASQAGYPAEVVPADEMSSTIERQKLQLSRPTVHDRAELARLLVGDKCNLVTTSTQRTLLATLWKGGYVVRPRKFSEEVRFLGEYVQLEYAVWLKCSDSNRSVYFFQLFGPVGSRHVLLHQIGAKWFDSAQKSWNADEISRSRVQSVRTSQSDWNEVSRILVGKTTSLKVSGPDKALFKKLHAQGWSLIPRASTKFDKRWPGKHGDHMWLEYTKKRTTFSGPDFYIIDIYANVGGPRYVRIYSPAG